MGQSAKAVASHLLGMSAAGLLAVAVCSGPVRAQSLEAALAYAYQNNPQLNAQRAQLRSIDEGVAQALSGYRPQVSVSADVGRQYQRSEVETSTGGRTIAESTTTPRGAAITATQTLFNGFQTANRTRQAEQTVQQQRAALALIEQTVLFDVVTQYMNILRDTAIVDLQRRNLEVLDEQLRQTRDRFNVGEVTRTDVAQSESRLAASRSQLLTAEANLATTRAAFIRVVGLPPTRLVPGRPGDRLIPKSLDAAVALAIAENPSVVAAMFGIDVALLQVKINEGALYPTLTLQGSAQQRYDSSDNARESFSASVVTRLVIPIYQGGAEYSQIRQSKEVVGQRRFELAQFRDQARATAVQAWSLLEAARAQITAAQAQVTAAEIALNGVREEARVGQRTTLDVLNAQQELVNARVALVTAQRDRVVASYNVVQSIGRMTADRLGLASELYDPRTHYYQVRDQWFGVRSPDGR